MLYIEKTSKVEIHVDVYTISLKGNTTNKVWHQILLSALIVHILKL